MMSSYYRLSQLATTPEQKGLLPVGPATVWRWVKAGNFPKPFKLGARVTVWDSEAVDAWISQRKGVTQ